LSHRSSLDTFQLHFESQFLPCHGNPPTLRW
jgi:hypothetical protein